MKRNQVLVAGQKVWISHDQGDELAEIFSINYLTGKAVMFASNPDCPHYFNVNISQLTSFELSLV
jgi:hypothetical protein